MRTSYSGCALPCLLHDAACRVSHALVAEAGGRGSCLNLLGTLVLALDSRLDQRGVPEGFADRTE